MKSATVILAIVFDLSLLLMYSSGLVGSNRTPESSSTVKSPTGGTVSERSASEPIKAQAGATQTKAEETDHSGSSEMRKGESAEGKEVVDSKDGKELLEPVAGEESRLRVARGDGRRSTEIIPERRSQARGILAPANPANVDPPVVSPESR